MKTFRDLIAWQRGMDLARAIYRVTQALPEEEKFGLCSQMRRAAISIPSNIAEGHGRETRKDYLKHLRFSRGSLAELATQFELATSMGMLKDDPTTVDPLQEEDRILQALIRSLRDAPPRQ